MRSQGQFFAFRLKPKEDLKKSLLHFARINKISAGAIVTCVGSLEKTNLRFANQKEACSEVGYFEILSLSGTFSSNYAHLHLSVADKNGNEKGGHLMEDNVVYTTAEIVIVELTDLRFEREVDPTYDFSELTIRKTVD